MFPVSRVAAVGALVGFINASKDGALFIAADERREDSGVRTQHHPEATGPSRPNAVPWPLKSIAAAACKAPDNAVSAAQVEKAVEDIGLLLDEHMHRARLKLSNETGAPRPSVSIDSNGFRAMFTVPRGSISAEALVEGIRSVVGSLQSHSISISKRDTFGDEGRASSIRVQTHGLGNLSIDLLQPFDMKEDLKMEVQGDLLAGSVELMRGTMVYMFSPERNSARERRMDNTLWGTMTHGDPAEIFGNMGDIMRLLMEETRRAGVAMGDLDVDRGVGGGGSPEFQGRGVASAGSYRKQKATGAVSEAEMLADTLEQRGILTYLPEKNSDRGQKDVDSVSVDWHGLAGYDAQKKQIEENLLLPLRRPEVFDEIAKKTRAHYTSNRPRAILFTGPPGTGKTSSARIIASQAGVPLCYIPLESISSKWYGESEKMLSEALEMINAGFPDGAVIFLDELDSLATKRGSDMHEATRRMLGVLLRFLDGFDQNKRAVIVGATNTPEDLDPALRSRFSANIQFGLPDEKCRIEILKQYAQHLPEQDVQALAKATSHCSGRDLRDICGYAERHWATLIIKGTVHEGSTPGLTVYLEAARARCVDIHQA